MNKLYNASESYLLFFTGPLISPVKMFNLQLLVSLEPGKEIIVQINKAHANKEVFQQIVSNVPECHAGSDVFTM